MKIVCLGGGHGLAQVLSAIRPLCSDLTAVVATTDNGGSTGRLRESQECVALGDIRRCCLQLTDKQSLIHSIFEHRFDGGELDGHSLGNLTLLGLMQLTDSPTEAVAWFNAMLGNAETILPMSDSATDLVATYANGEQVVGECEIDALTELPDAIGLSKSVRAAKGAVDAITNADLVLIGPGSIISSVMPPLLVKEIGDAIENTAACRIFIENIAEENSVARSLKGETIIDWMQEKLGYQFCDLSISPQAIEEIVVHCDELNDAQSTQHNIEQLSHVFSQLLKLPLSTKVNSTCTIN
ncbi:uridine diphosphate-N-acetylglucosamine-binding protein YvcK [Pseudoalteromonas sp. MMG013]|uniref:gluconeogenesis factor YvcK family protein n=1 Tax=Pseudoalteromonas sp. MMG013 TaxID=2822687 RepID=UPI001B38641B|nr:uridine diphosphate-N-acetylglucosamine-binding protein YvcK [Pseudoalteromonas sp. MMG013]MBQ4863527.1 uridine diphosphate-N-acetylglucosamine-binding protein YvcK [Pseudoalteromonas sp. MMG013]